MGPPLVHPVHLIQSITQCHDNNPSRLDIPRKYNMSLPRAWISMLGPRVHLEVSMTIVSIDSRLTNPFPACRRFSSFWCFIFVSHQEDKSDAAAWSYMCILLRYYLVN